MNLQIVLNTPKNPYFNQATTKEILAKFSYPKTSCNQKYQTPQKSFVHPHHLKCGVPTCSGIGASCQLASILLLKNAWCSTNICLEKEMIVKKGGFR